MKARRHKKSTRLSTHTNGRIIGYTSICPVVKLRRSLKLPSHKCVSFVGELEAANNMPTGAKQSSRETRNVLRPSHSVAILDRVRVHLPQEIIYGCKLQEKRQRKGVERARAVAED